MKQSPSSRSYLLGDVPVVARPGDVIVAGADAAADAHLDEPQDVSLGCLEVPRVTGGSVR